ncbi:MAG: hypothetical protein KAT44_08200, partial [Pirellulales bacterium]|nr:hypothetical protein [Pirellulales bacterium]
MMKHFFNVSVDYLFSVVIKLRYVDHCNGAYSGNLSHYSSDLNTATTLLPQNRLSSFRNKLSLSLNQTYSTYHRSHWLPKDSTELAAEV